MTSPEEEIRTPKSRWRWWRRGVVLVAIAAIGTTLVQHARHHNRDVAYRDNSGAVVKTMQMDPSALRSGDCIQAQLSDFDDFHLEFGLSAVTIVPCRSAHDGEIFATGSIGSESTFPARATINARSHTTCQAAVGPWSAQLSKDTKYYDITPSPNSWAGGDHLVKCLVFLANAAWPYHVSADQTAA